MQVCHAFVDINVFLWLRKQRPRFAQGQPKGSFQLKELHRTLKLILKWILIERWGRPSMLSSMCQHVARLQFYSCAEKDSLCGTVMIHDGLNLRCLDQCHGVRSHGRSSYQSWRKRLVIRQSEFDPWVYILVSPKVIYAGLPRKAFPRKHAFVDISVFRWLGKQRPRFARGLPKGNFQLKELHRTTKAYSHMNADWNWRRPNVLSSIRQHVARLQFDSCAKKDSLCVTVMIYDGLNLRYLDQCHGVRSHGKSSSQSWRKRIVIQQSEFSL